MSKRINSHIRDNFELFSELLALRKSIFDDVVSISRAKPSNGNFLLEITQVKHATLPHDIVLMSEVKMTDYKFFRFQLRCTTLASEPFFRYDNDGPAHQNHYENIPLSEQMITTPHFNTFKNTGEAIAYKTQELKNEQSKKALEDIEICIAHFFHEGNIRLRQDEFPSVTILPTMLQFAFTDNDPNSGATFS